MSEKRFECVFVEDIENGGHFRRVKDKETERVYFVCDVVDLLNSLYDENEQLRKKLESLQKLLHIVEVVDDK